MLHPRAFKVSVVWTLALLFLGSVVHATESSLACPDWPTCFGTMVPEMTGGVFWEHLHRLVAGGLLLMWGLATWLAYRESERPWVFRAAFVGVGLLLVQSVFGGLTVIYRLPDLVSTTHLTLALVFLALATVLASATERDSGREDAPTNAAPGERTEASFPVRTWAAAAAGLVLAQSVLGALVRHMDAGMACPDAPLCLGQVVPPLVNAPITVHYFHRVLAVVVAVVVCAFAYRLYGTRLPYRIRRWGVVAAALVLAQVGLGFWSVLSVLDVAPVSLHTLVAASLLAVLSHVATVTAPVRQRSVGSAAPARSA